MHVNGTTFGHTLYVIPDLNSEIILMHSVKTVKLSYHEIFCTSLSQIKKKTNKKTIYNMGSIYDCLSCIPFCHNFMPFLMDFTILLFYQPGNQ